MNGWHYGVRTTNYNLNSAKVPKEHYTYAVIFIISITKSYKTIMSVTKYRISGLPSLSTEYRGYTLLEIIVAIAIIGVLASIATQTYQSYFDRLDRSQAISDLNILSAQIDAYSYDHNGQFPDSLADVHSEGYLDPWGNPYQYLNIVDNPGNGNTRKDRNLVPINSDYDLYSKGKDGESVGPLTARKSQDDIIRANNGEFIDIASNY